MNSLYATGTLAAIVWKCSHEPRDGFTVSCPGGLEWPDVYAGRDHSESMYIERLQAARRGEAICPCYNRYCRLDHGNRVI